MRRATAAYRVSASSPCDSRRSRDGAWVWKSPGTRVGLLLPQGSVGCRSKVQAQVQTKRQLSQRAGHPVSSRGEQLLPGETEATLQVRSECGQHRGEDSLVPGRLLFQRAVDFLRRPAYSATGRPSRIKFPLISAFLPFKLFLQIPGPTSWQEVDLPSGLLVSQV